MGKIFTNVWIMINGIMIYQDGSEIDGQKQMLGGFFSAINMMAQQITKEGLSNIEMGKQRLYFHQSGVITFIASAPIIMKQRKAQDELIRIIDEFYNLYSQEEIERWNGNLGYFQKLNSAFSQVVPLEKMQTAFW